MPIRITKLARLDNKRFYDQTTCFIKIFYTIYKIRPLNTLSCHYLIKAMNTEERTILYVIIAQSQSQWTMAWTEFAGKLAELSEWLGGGGRWRERDRMWRRRQIISWDDISCQPRPARPPSWAWTHIPLQFIRPSHVYRHSVYWRLWD